MNTNSRVLRINVGLALALAVAVLPAVAGEGRTPIWKPGAITAAGKYIVTRNIDAAAGLPAIDIQAYGVDIDLNGFTLTANGAAVVRSIGQADVSIRNGKLAGGTYGVHVEGGAMGAGSFMIVEGLKIRGQDFAGIYLNGARGFTVRRNFIEQAGADGILVEKLPPLEGNVSGTIEGNQIFNCSGGITVGKGSIVAILNNHLKDITAAGASGAIQCRECQGAVVASNTVKFVEVGSGILLDESHGCQVESNLIVVAADRGIALSDASDNTIVGNTITGASSDALYVKGSRNVLERNHTTSNFGGYGIRFVDISSQNNTFGRNTARGNSGGGCLGVGFGGDFCDEGINNSTFGDNLVPNLF